jgi:hypothetical protein
MKLFTAKAQRAFSTLSLKESVGERGVDYILSLLLRY